MSEAGDDSQRYFRAIEEAFIRLRGAPLLLLVNAGGRAVPFQLPKIDGRGHWHEEINTSRSGSRRLRHDRINLAAHSLSLAIFSAGD